MINDYLSHVVTAQKNEIARGITSICSAHPFVIEAALRNVSGSRPVLIESTCNQVNQFGGYTGMTPVQFRDYVWTIADEVGFPRERIILGGDHLGPSPWQDESAATAMVKARTLIRDYVQAGYTKIHLDTSMKCGDDDPDRPLDKRISAQRAANLASIAESTHDKRNTSIPRPKYVIGTEVPVPGGPEELEESISVTPVVEAEETIEVTKQVFLERGLEGAWERVVALVVQPGVEFGDTKLFKYNRDQARDLSQFIRECDHLVFEAHSTDYQTAGALRHMVEDQFAILKVGPALTFAFREAIFALAMIEEELFSSKEDIELSHVRTRLEDTMLAQPTYWQKYYQGGSEEQRFARKYSYSDRSRYYWTVEEVQTSLVNLIRNLMVGPIPHSLLSQYLPVQYGRVRNQELTNSPRVLILDKITAVLTDYDYACGFMNSNQG